jgi:hypothetical protein
MNPDPETLAPARDAPFFDDEKRGALVTVLEERFDMAPEDAAEIANVVIEQFGEGAEANDEQLDPSVRSIFYTLEAKKILSFRREEYTTEAGEKRRGFWWRVREGELSKVTSLVPEGPEEDVYASLPKDAWTARQHA